jgi:hypothetical protein
MPRLILFHLSKVHENNTMRQANTLAILFKIYNRTTVSNKQGTNKFSDLLWLLFQKMLNSSLKCKLNCLPKCQISYAPLPTTLYQLQLETSDHRQYQPFLTNLRLLLQSDSLPLNLAHRMSKIPARYKTW